MKNNTIVVSENNDMNDKIFTAFMNSLFAGLSTGIGALIIFFLKLKP